MFVDSVGIFVDSVGISVVSVGIFVDSVGILVDSVGISVVSVIVSDVISGAIHTLLTTSFSLYSIISESSLHLMQLLNWSH